MTELKTLKDIERITLVLNNGTTTESNFKEGFLVSKSNELKQEAIKWVRSLIEEIRIINNKIKELNLQFDDEVKPRQVDYRVVLSNKIEKEINFREQIMKIGSQIHWIKHFFNITDEDLKND